MTIISYFKKLAYLARLENAQRWQTNEPPFNMWALFALRLDLLMSCLCPFLSTCGLTTPGTHQNVDE